MSSLDQPTPAQTVETDGSALSVPSHPERVDREVESWGLGFAWKNGMAASFSCVCQPSRAIEQTPSLKWSKIVEVQSTQGHKGTKAGRRRWKWRAWKTDARASVSPQAGFEHRQGAVSGMDTVSTLGGAMFYSLLYHCSFCQHKASLESSHGHLGEEWARPLEVLKWKKRPLT